MKIFKELNKLGYIHYSATTIEELDDLPLNSAERISEQALVLRWFREKYNLHSTITSISQESWQWHITKPGESLGKLYEEDFYTYEEAELECLKKLIEIVKNGKSLEHSHEYSIKEQSVDKKSHT
jgi:hypothetical protein